METTEISCSGEKGTAGVELPGIPLATDGVGTAPGREISGDLRGEA